MPEPHLQGKNIPSKLNLCTIYELTEESGYYPARLGMSRWAPPAQRFIAVRDKVILPSW